MGAVSARGKEKQRDLMGFTAEISTLEEMCDLMCDNKLPKEGDHNGNSHNVRPLSDAGIAAQDKDTNDQEKGEDYKILNHGLKLHQDGTLEIILPKGKKVSKVLIGESGKQGVYYQYGELIRCEECKFQHAGTALELLP